MKCFLEILSFLLLLQIFNLIELVFMYVRRHYSLYFLLYLATFNQ